MNQLKVDPATLTSVATTYATVAADIGSAASQIDADDLGLAAVFGVVGTDFVAAVEATTGRYRRQVAVLADDTRTFSTDVRAAGADYRGTDESASAEIGAASTHGPDHTVA